MRRLRGAPLKLTAAAAFLLSVILFAGLQLRPMAPSDPEVALAAFAMPDGTLPQICGGSDGHMPRPGVPHCPACLGAHSPGLVTAPVALGRVLSVPVAVAEIPPVHPRQFGPSWPPHQPRAPPLAAFA